jgi:hypothetical protein
MDLAPTPLRCTDADVRGLRPDNPDISGCRPRPLQPMGYPGTTRFMDQFKS